MVYMFPVVLLIETGLILVFSIYVVIASYGDVVKHILTFGAYTILLIFFIPLAFLQLYKFTWIWSMLFGAS